METASSTFFLASDSAHQRFLLLLQDCSLDRNTCWQVHRSISTQINFYIYAKMVFFNVKFVLKNPKRMKYCAWEEQ